MEKTIDVVIHNRFDFEVRDAVTGELKQTAHAHNIILNNMWTKLCAGATFFTYVALGTGTGTLDATRTSLFTPLITRMANQVSYVIAYPTCYDKRSIQLAPEECVGSVIREVGIAYSGTNISAGYMVTHALLQDSEGNPISITKTATDIVTVYATVFSSLADTADISAIGFDGSNELLRYFTGGLAPLSSLTLWTGPSGAPSVRKQANVTGYRLGGITITMNTTADVANKKMTSNVARFATTQSNGHIKEITLGNIGRMVLPCAACPAKAYTGVSLGTGDGTTTKFAVPSRNIEPTSLVVKVNGVATSDYATELERRVNFRVNKTMDNGQFGNYTCQMAIDKTKSMWVGLIYDVLYYGTYEHGTIIQTGKYSSGASVYKDVCFDISPVESLIAVPSGTTVKFYTLDSGAMQPSTVTLDTAPGSEVYIVAFSEDGQHLAVAAASKPLWIYKKVGSVFQKLTTVAATANFTSTNISTYTVLKYFGNILCVGSSTSQFPGKGMCILKRTDDTYTLTTITNPTGTVPGGGGCWGLAMNAAKDRLIFGGGTNYLPCFSIDADGNATQLADIQLTGLSTSNWNGKMALTDDNYILIMNWTTTKYCYLCKWDGAASAPVVDTYDEAASFGETSYYYLYPGDCGSFVKLTDDVYAVPAGNNNSNYRYFHSIDIANRNTNVKFNAAPAANAAITSDYSVNGIHKTDQYVIDMQFSIQFGEGV